MYVRPQKDTCTIQHYCTLWLMEGNVIITFGIGQLSFWGGSNKRSNFDIHEYDLPIGFSFRALRYFPCHQIMISCNVSRSTNHDSYPALHSDIHQHVRTLACSHGKSVLSNENVIAATSTLSHVQQFIKWCMHWTWHGSTQHHHAKHMTLKQPAHIFWTCKS